MNSETKSKLVALHQAAVAFLVKTSPNWVAVLAGVVGVVVGAWLF